LSLGGAEHSLALILSLYSEQSFFHRSQSTQETEAVCMASRGNWEAVWLGGKTQQMWLRDTSKI